MDDIPTIPTINPDSFDVVSAVGSDSVVIPVGPSADALLLENGSYVLLEDGSYLLLE